MLSPDDAQLAEHDPALPWLGMLLDDAQLTRELQGALGDQIQNVRSTYVRYKPGTSILLGLTLSTPTGDYQAHAIHVRAAESEKFRKPLSRTSTNNPFGEVEIRLREGVRVRLFPNDHEISRLPDLHSAEKLQKIIRRTAPAQLTLRQATLHPLAYKPERRFTGKLVQNGNPVAVLKAYSQHEFQSLKNPRIKEGIVQDSVAARVLGVSEHYQIRISEWLDGAPLCSHLGLLESTLPALHQVGKSLALLHQYHPSDDLRENSTWNIATALAIDHGILSIAPALQALVQTIKEPLRNSGLISQQNAWLHGDLHPGQILMAGERAQFIDLDEARSGDPAEDLGNLLAHLIYLECKNPGWMAKVDSSYDALLTGYSAGLARVLRANVVWFTGLGLLKLCVRAFRNREPEWLATARETLEAAHQFLNANKSVPATKTIPTSHENKEAAFTLLIQHALSPNAVMPLIANTSDLVAEPLASLVRVKPLRRALIAYEFQTNTGPRFWVGKIRAKGLDRRSFETSCALWESGFGQDAGDGISTPKPIGQIPSLHMIVHEKVSGKPYASLLETSEAIPATYRVCQSLAKLHRVQWTPPRVHSIDDEMTILRDRLSRAKALIPNVANSIEGLIERCESDALLIANHRLCCIHRDFYQDQILIDENRTQLLDLDLVSLGDPALDYANLIAHLIEFDIRRVGKLLKMIPLIRVVQEQFASTHGEPRLDDLQRLVRISLARHIYLSQTCSGRQHTTSQILALCHEQNPLSGINDPLAQ